MKIVNLWIELSSRSLFKEKSSAGYLNFPFTREMSSRFQSLQYASVRVSFSFSSDVSMLSCALLSLSPYLSTSDKVTCRKVQNNYSLTFDLDTRRHTLSNVPFFFYFFLASFATDKVYSFWTHGRAVSKTSRHQTLHFRSRLPSFEGFYDDYFFGVIDANFWFFLCIDLQYMNGKTVNVMDRLTSSLLFLSFCNTSFTAK